MKTSLNLFLLAALFAGDGAVLGQTTNSIILSNPSFENPAVSDGNYESTSMPGWITSASGSAVVAIINPGPGNWPSATPAGMDGNNCGQIFAYGTGGGGQVYQDTGVQFQVGVTYQLTVAIGRESNQTFNDNGATIVFFNSALGMVASKTLSSANITPGGFTDVTLTYTATGNEGGNSNILVGLQAPASSDGQTYLNFDNVRLTAIVPMIVTYIGPASIGSRFFRISGPAASAIIAFRIDGTLVWSNALLGTNYTIQTLTQLSGGTNWVDFIQLPATSGINTNKLIDQNPQAGMAFIPAGVFTMGDNLGDGPAVGSNYEVPLHSVYVSAFYMDKYDVNKALWDSVSRPLKNG